MSAGAAIVVPMTVTVDAVRVPMDVTQEAQTVEMGVSTDIRLASDPYTGDYSVTPGAEATVLPTAGLRMTDDVTVLAIPERFYDMSGDMAWLGKDAECINESVYSKSGALKDTLYKGWTPSTTAKAIVATATAGTFAADLSQYQYFLVWECGVDPVYTGTPAQTALPLLSRAYIVQELMKRPSSWANIEAGNFNGNACASLYASTLLRYYGTTTGTVTYTWAASYGFYFGATAATFSNSTADSVTVTVKSPTLSTRCSTTYFSTGNAALVDQDKSTYFIRGKVYRVRANATLRSIYGKVAGLVNG